MFRHNFPHIRDKGGVRAAFLPSGYENMPETLAEIRRAGAERVVLLSGGSAGSGDLGPAAGSRIVDG